MEEGQARELINEFRRDFPERSDVSFFIGVTDENGKSGFLKSGLSDLETLEIYLQSNANPVCQRVFDDSNPNPTRTTVIIKEFLPFKPDDYTFFHEMGHALLYIYPNSGSSKFESNLNEEFADTYAVLKYIQKHGLDSIDRLRSMANASLDNVINATRDSYKTQTYDVRDGYEVHFTFHAMHQAIDHVIGLNNFEDFKRLSGSEILELAKDIIGPENEHQFYNRKSAISDLLDLVSNPTVEISPENQNIIRAIGARAPIDLYSNFLTSGESRFASSDRFDRDMFSSVAWAIKIDEKSPNGISLNDLVMNKDIPKSSLRDFLKYTDCGRLLTEKDIKTAQETCAGDESKKNHVVGGLINAIAARVVMKRAGYSEPTNVREYLGGKLCSVFNKVCESVSNVFNPRRKKEPLAITGPSGRR